MAALPVPPVIPHFKLDPSLPVLFREAFSHNGKVYVGTQWTGWQRDEEKWNFRLGKFRGTGEFFRVVASNLWIDGATEETHGNDPLARVASGTAITPTCGALYGTPKGFHFRLYNAATGALTAQGSGQSGLSLGTVPDGSYVLWARAYEFLNVEGQCGEWSAVKVRVGSGSWMLGAGISPSPGCPLYVKNQEDAEVEIDLLTGAGNRVAFDPLARTVSASVVLEKPVLKKNGTEAIPAGALLIAGLRASRSGPQCAIWQLADDGTATLRALTAVFSSGQCECGKSDHHASDLVQAEDGTLYLLNECSLHRYAPDGTALADRLPGDPLATDGHPGGQCLRFYEGLKIYSTELLTAAPIDLGPYFYNRLVFRLGGRDYIGPGTLWHGPNFAEIYNGRWWSTRASSTDLSNENTLVILDTLVNARWSEGGGANGGIQRPAATHRWRQLRRRGNQLWVFGFQPGETDDGTDDAALTAVVEDGRLKPVQFPYFVRRVTRSRNASGNETLLVIANREQDGNGTSMGFQPLRVVELSPDNAGGSGGGEKLCFFWNEGAGEFRLSRTQYEGAGGDTTKLPAYLFWQPTEGYNGGGLWRVTNTLPTTGNWLTVSVHSTYIALTPAAAPHDLPYDPDWWGLICITILDDGTPRFNPEPQPTCENAQCVIDQMPDGTGFRAIRLTVPDPAMPASAVQLTDIQVDKTLMAERDLYPTLWIRGDSTAPLNDLSSYTQLAHFGRQEYTAEPRKLTVDGVIIVTPETQPVQLCALQRRI